MGTATADMSSPMASATAPDRIPSLVSTRSAAAILGCHSRTVRRLKDAGRLRERQFPGFRDLLFDLDEVMELRRSGYERDRPKVAA